MKKKITGLLMCFVLPAAVVLAQLPVKVMSYNIRLDVAADGDNRWALRKDKVAALINYYEADFIGGQEVQHHQLQYLLLQLPAYGYIGAGRDDGKQAGEYSCIFYNQQQYELLQQSTFWLSPTPDTVSMGWDAACHRVCTYGLFRHKKTGKRLWVFNTHFDHMGVMAREQSAHLITARIKAITAQKNYPVIITGDFNSTPTEAPALYLQQYFANARSISQAPAYGPADTWNAFAFDKKPAGCIDYIFVSRPNKVTRFATITDSYDTKYPSDHFPILATILLK
jgi:endonuclease/exonuclease/phosphatase family metal-dependent hydrolase